MSGGGGGVSISPGERAEADLSNERYQDYQNRFVPLEAQYFDTVDDIPKSRDKAKGAASADVALAYDPAIRSTLDRGLSSGANPNSGKFMGTLSDLSASRASAESGGVINADVGTDDRYIEGLNKIVSLGRGVSRDAQAGYRTLANIDASNAISKAQADSIKTGMLYDIAGMATGAGIRAYGADAKKALGKIGNNTAGKAYLSLAYPNNEWANAPGPIRR